MQHVVHWEPDDMQRLLVVFRGKQIVDVSYADFRWIAGVDSTTTGASSVKFWCRVVRVNDVLRFNAETRKVGVEQRRIAVSIQQAWNTDAKFLAPFHQCDTLLGLFRYEEPFCIRNCIGDNFHLTMTED